MTFRAAYLQRDALFRALGGDQRLVRAFEDQALAVESSTEVAATVVEATEALQDASVVTLSENGAFTNERVLTASETVQIDASQEGLVKLRVKGVALAQGFTPVFAAPGNITYTLPPTGSLVSRDSTDTLSNKTLAAPLLSGLVNAASDAAAATAGVPVGGVYHNSGILRVRLA